LSGLDAGLASRKFCDFAKHLISYLWQGSLSEAISGLLGDYGVELLVDGLVEVIAYSTIV
jgi:hypothetical protein